MRTQSSGSSEDGNHEALEAPHVFSLPMGPNDSESRSTVPSPSPVPTPVSPSKFDRRRSADQRRRTNKPPSDWKSALSRNGLLTKGRPLLNSAASGHLSLGPPTNRGRVRERNNMPGQDFLERQRLRSPWRIPFLALFISLVGIGFLVAIVNSLMTKEFDPKGCRMSYMRPSYTRLKGFDTEHTRLASKYSLYLYREQGVDEGTRVRGIPVLFIPGNAGSYKQVRPIAAEAANYFHDALQHSAEAIAAGVRGLDFFTVDFNEDITAFHGQTLLDQAEYLNEAIRYILSLYLDPHSADRDPDLPDPASVIVLGHSMGGIVARTMLVMPNYQSNSINTVITMSAPHARAPVSFDGQIVKIYQEINDYWRHAYSQKWANNNPLWHVTLVSIAGGNLDTVVPSDYASLESLVPDTHGFTVFTSTIPTVWTSMDHQAILWCDQFRKVIARALYDVVDVNRATQTKPRADRMRVFKKWFLTGLETIAEKTVPVKEHSTLLTVDEKLDSVVAQGERFVLRGIGSTRQARAHLIPIPPSDSPGAKRFTLLTDVKLDKPNDNGKLEVLFCSLFPLQPAQSSMTVSNQMDFSGDNARATRLACKNPGPDVSLLPASTRETSFPFTKDEEKEMEPWSYLQYDVDHISDHQYVAVLEKATTPGQGFVVAEFSDQARYHMTQHVSLNRLLSFGLRLHLPSTRPMVTEVTIPSMQSSLLAYTLKIGNQACGDSPELFTPLIRQYLSEPYESKYFVNARQAAISIHGVAPYLPPPLRRRSGHDGITFQFWTDPTCGSSLDLKLAVDMMSTMGKLYMRYRTVFAAFPLFVVALVLRKQFRVYDRTGVFISFADGLDLCLRQSIPLMLLLLTIMSTWLDMSGFEGNAKFWHWRNTTAPSIDFYQNEILAGTRDAFFWFLIPLIGLICIGVCAVLSYLALAMTYILSLFLGLLNAGRGWSRHDDRKGATLSAFMPSSPRRRMITTAVLLLLVSTFIPYQFAYMVACLVQLTTAVRAQKIAAELRSTTNQSFHNYVHSILILMLWILPINLPILVVWIHNLAVHWLTPFSSHHNVMSIMPFIVLVETLTTGKMVPRLTSGLRHVTSLVLFGTSLYAAVYGVSYAYMLHYLVNLVAAWLVVVHSTSDLWTLSGISALYEGDTEDRKRGKEP